MQNVHIKSRSSIKFSRHQFIAVFIFIVSLLLLVLATVEEQALVMRHQSYIPTLVVACGVFLFSPFIINAAVLPAIESRAPGFNGMGFASIILAVIDYLKGSNAYVSSGFSWYLAKVISPHADTVDRTQ